MHFAKQIKDLGVHLSITFDGVVTSASSKVDASLVGKGMMEVVFCTVVKGNSFVESVDGIVVVTVSNGTFRVAIINGVFEFSDDVHGHVEVGSTLLDNFCGHEAVVRFCVDDDKGNKTKTCLMKTYQHGHPYQYQPVG